MKAPSTECALLALRAIPCIFFAWYMGSPWTVGRCVFRFYNCEKSCREYKVALSSRLVVCTTPCIYWQSRLLSLFYRSIIITLLTPFCRLAT
ncbi:hypothetical protein BJY00DRAFT_184753 [Aspergillus carlsbadensis]|nr:hypothetical protein BJY00DRAFT_184753 [Aspergillus carlsbadensis]